MDHDRLFKELLSTFFLEFVELFLPQVSEYLDKGASLVPVSNEVFTDITQGERHEVDLLMQVEFREQDAFFLIHVENQASAQSDFPKRMHRYFARLTEKYDLPVYPVVVFSYDLPKRPEPSVYRVEFPNKTVLRFNYDVIQLNRLPWRRFVRQENPVASALMAKMKMSVTDRPKVKSECMRLLSSLKLDPARSKLIAVFVETYLNLNAAELKQYEREIEKFAPAERKATMELMTSWEKSGLAKGIEQGLERGLEQGIERGLEQGIGLGLQQGKEVLLVRLIARRFGQAPIALTKSLDRLSAEQLDELGEALLDFSSLADLESWLTLHNYDV
jgi:hypothetical protein